MGPELQRINVLRHRQHHVPVLRLFLPGPASLVTSDGHVWWATSGGNANDLSVLWSGDLLRMIRGGSGNAAHLMLRTALGILRRGGARSARPGLACGAIVAFASVALGCDLFSPR